MDRNSYNNNRNSHNRNVSPVSVGQKLLEENDDNNNDDGILYKGYFAAGTTKEPLELSEKQEESLPLFQMGVIADIQYAPIPDGFSFGGKPRYYRHSLEVARHAADHFERQGVALVLNLGDTIDGKCQDIVGNGGEPIPEGIDPGHKSIDDVLQALSAYQRGPILHTYGNHELYNLDRTALSKKLGIPFVREPCGDLVGYHSHHCQQGIRFVIIDSYDVAQMQRCETTSHKHREATRILTNENPNMQEDNPNSSEGMEGLNRRFVAFNGAVGQIQLSWLRQTLTEARNNHEKVIILSHQPILPGSSNPVTLVWNYEDVLQILRQFSDIVIASFSGHSHRDGYERDEESGIHFRVFEAALETPYPHKTYGIVDVHHDRLVVHGFGNCSSAVYDFHHLEETNKSNFATTAIEESVVG